MKQKPKEYKNHLDRLQMSLFNMLYRKAGGYLMVPSYVLKNIKEKTEWGKLKNFPQAYKIIEDEYFNEANETLNSWVNVKSGSYSISGGDYAPVASRFSYAVEDRNGNLKPGAKPIVDSYKDFVLRVGKRLKFEFNSNFSYFAGKESE